MEAGEEDLREVPKERFTLDFNLDGEKVEEDGVEGLVVRTGESRRRAGDRRPKVGR